MKNIFRNADGDVNTQVDVAIIGASATLLTALIAGAFGLIQLRTANAPPPSPTIQSAPTVVATPQLEVEIEGPTEVPLNQQTYFTILSDDAIRADWTITNFGRGSIEPFDQVSQVYVEPEDSSRVGQSFVIVVRVFDKDNNDASARHRFQVVEE